MDVPRGSYLVLVTGATGALGPRVVEALHATGHCVRTFSLDGAPAGLLPAEVDQQQGEISDLGALRKAMQGVNGVIHLAALLHKTDPPPEWRDRYYSVNVEGTRQVLHAALGAGVRRLVFFSTIGVYGPSRGQVQDESTIPHPDTLYGESKWQAEQVVLAARDCEGRPIGTVLRMGAVYGPRIKGNYQRLLRSLARGRFIPIGRGNNRRTLVYDRDAAAAGILAMHHPAAAGKVYNVSDGRFHTLRELIITMCAALGRTPPRIFVPVGPAHMTACMLEAAGGIMGLRSPVVRATVEKYTEDVAVECQRIMAELAFVPQFDLAAGWRETIHEMRRMGEL